MACERTFHDMMVIGLWTSDLELLEMLLTSEKVEMLLLEQLEGDEVMGMNFLLTVWPLDSGHVIWYIVRDTLARSLVDLIPDNLCASIRSSIKFEKQDGIFT